MVTIHNAVTSNYKLHALENYSYQQDATTPSCFTAALYGNATGRSGSQMNFISKHLKLDFFTAESLLFFSSEVTLISFYVNKVWVNKVCNFDSQLLASLLHLSPSSTKTGEWKQYMTREPDSTGWQTGKNSIFFVWSTNPMNNSEPTINVVCKYCGICWN